ncbi:hypothetical protein RhiirB3_434957 [Rhizophagus irregularis]|nr:hypothetical protein RhiirB3_434957 [Rhizophagus irregularis]
MEETNKELSMRPQYGIVEEESKGRVDYAIKEAEDLIYITGDKQHKIPVGGTGTSFYIVLKKIPRQAIPPIQSNLSRRPWLMIPKNNLRIQTHRVNAIWRKGVGVDRIKLVTCSASDISRLNNTQIQNIIGYVNAKTVTNGNDQSHVTSAESVSPQASYCRKWKSASL